MHHSKGLKHMVAKFSAIFCTIAIAFAGIMPYGDSTFFRDTLGNIASVTTVHAESIIASGYWGSCQWRITADGLLIIQSGKGSDTHDRSPWQQWKSEITGVITEGAVTFPEDCSDLFAFFSNCTSIDLNGVDTHQVTNMRDMFIGNTSLAFLDCSTFNTASVTSMYTMFNGCENITSLNLGSYDFSSVNNAGGMFAGCSKLKVIYASSTLAKSQVNDTTVFSGNNMLSGGEGTSFSFATPANNGRYAKIDGGTASPGFFTSVTKAANQYIAGTIKKDFSDGKVVGAGIWGEVPWLITVSGNASYVGDLTELTLHFGGGGSAQGADVSSDGAPWAKYASNITSITGDEIILPSNCQGLFHGLSINDVDLAQFNMKSATNITGMFSNCQNLTYAYPHNSSKTTSIQNVKSMTSTFGNCPELILVSLKTWKNGNSISDMNNMFGNDKNLRNVQLPELSGDEIDAYVMFSGCTSLTELDLSSISANKLSAEGLCSGCTSLRRVQLPQYSNAGGNNYAWFADCPALKAIDISILDMQAGNYGGMFSQSPNITSITVGARTNLVDIQLPLPSTDNGYTGKWVKNASKNHSTALTTEELISHYTAESAAAGTGEATTWVWEKSSSMVGQYGEQEDPVDKDGSLLKGTVTINGLMGAGTIEVYQIVDGYYKDGIFSKWVLIDPINGKIAAIGDASKGQVSGVNDIITEDEITDISNRIDAALISSPINDNCFDIDIDGIDGKGTHIIPVSGDRVTVDLEPGMYLVRASSTNDPKYGVSPIVYNPAVVAVNITDVNNGKIEAGNLNMGSFFTTSDGQSMASAYLKASRSETLDTDGSSVRGNASDAVLPEGAQVGDNNPAINAHGDIVAKNDILHIVHENIVLPSYSDDYLDDSWVKITEYLSRKFKKPSSLKITVAGNIVEPSESSYSVNYTDDGFYIRIPDSFLKELRSKNDSDRTMTLSYDTGLVNPSFNFSENHIRTVMTYDTLSANTYYDSGTGGIATHHPEIKSDYYVYTFALDAKIDADNPNALETYEFNKVGPEHTEYTAGKSNAPLQGAVFALYSDDTMTTKAGGSVVSDENGKLHIEGLDSGTYYMKETQAPSGYGLSDTSYRFTITPTLAENGVLSSYTVQTAYKDALHTDWTDLAESKYVSTATISQDGSISYEITRDDDPVSIINSPLQSLPSTGGAGLVRVIGVAAFAGIIGFRVNKRTKQKL